MEDMGACRRDARPGELPRLPATPPRLPVPPPRLSLTVPDLKGLMLGRVGAVPMGKGEVLRSGAGAVAAREVYGASGVLRPVVLSRRRRAASDGGSVACERTDADPDARELVRERGSGTGCRGGDRASGLLVCGGERPDSGMSRGGDRVGGARVEPRPSEPEEPTTLSRCWFLRSVGTKSGPSERKREESRLSSDSSENSGVVR